MRKLRLFVLVLFLLPSALSAQQTVKLKVQVVLIDKDLNLKPVPKFSFTLRKLGAEADQQPKPLKTGLDGIVEAELPAGRYQLSSVQPVDFQGTKYSWNFEVTLTSSQQTLELSNDNAVVTASAPPGGDDLTALFQRLQNSVVTVRSERADGTGFIVDSVGLILTNDHIVGKSTYLAVQFDAQHKVRAQLLASDASKDIAVLRANLSVFPAAVVVAIAPPQAEKAALVAGERVLTIGNPFGREKTVTMGVVSKIEPTEIISDISINSGSSGGPLFDFRGTAVGITTAGRQRLSRIIRIEEAAPLLEQARAKMQNQTAPEAALLPVEPTDWFPAETLKAVMQLEKLDTGPYYFDVGDFWVRVLTPPVQFWLAHEDEMKAARKKAKRTGASEPDAGGTAEVMAQAQHYKPVLRIWAGPKFGIMWKVKYKTDFYKMRLLCGTREIVPIDPGRTERALRKPNGDITDRTYQGFYTYPHDAISPSCGQVTLEIYSEKNPQQAAVKVFDSATVSRVWSDFEPYRNMHAKP